MKRGAFWRTLNPRVLLALAPIADLPLAGRSAIAMAGLACIGSGFLGDWLARQDGDPFTPSALSAYAVLVLAATLAGHAVARTVARGAIAPSVTALILALCAIVLPMIDWHPDAVPGNADPDYGFGALWLIATPPVSLLLLAMLRHWAPSTSLARRLFAAIVWPLAALHLAYRVDAWSSFYYTDDAEEAAEWNDVPAETFSESYEDLLARQDAAVDRSLASLSPPRAGRVDLYVVAMAGDSSEAVFRNEVETVATVASRRLDADGRIVRLINHADTLADTPLATLRNLQRSLVGIGERIDPDEDIVLLYLASHGATDHTWYTALGDLPLVQIGPDDVLDAFDSAGIRWRIAVVSSCYSGGFIDVLQSPTSLVVTAARGDRSSFGCGPDANLSYFGRAYVADALDRTGDFATAFEQAKAAIARREAADGFEPSEPQWSQGDAMAGQIKRWQAERATPPSAPEPPCPENPQTGRPRPAQTACPAPRAR